MTLNCHILSQSLMYYHFFTRQCVTGDPSSVTMTNYVMRAWNMNNTKNVRESYFMNMYSQYCITIVTQYEVKATHYLHTIILLPQQWLPKTLSKHLWWHVTHTIGNLVEENSWAFIKFHNTSLHKTINTFTSINTSVKHCLTRKKLHTDFN